MKILYIGVLKNTERPAVELAAEKELSSFSRFTRGSFSEFMTFFSKTVAERTKMGQRQAVEEQGHTFHVYARSEGVCGVIITDIEYPARVAQQLINKFLDEFLTKNPMDSFARLKDDHSVPFPELKQYISQYQNPENADGIMKIQRELDETKVVLHKTIESVLDRGEKLDDLAAKSSDLGMSSQAFYKQAKKQNSCCIVM